MNEIVLRLTIVKSGEVLEVLFDQRRTFSENFELFASLYPIDADVYVIDPLKGIALRKDVPLSTFCFPPFMELSLY